MENMKLYCLIYELKGIVSSMDNLIQEDERYYNPLVDSIEEKVNALVDHISTKKENDVLHTSIETK